MEEGGHNFSDGFLAHTAGNFVAGVLVFCEINSKGAPRDMFNQWSATGSATNTHTSRLHIVFLKNEKSSDRVRRTGLWCAEICFGS